MFSTAMIEPVIVLEINKYLSWHKFLSKGKLQGV